MGSARMRAASIALLAALTALPATAVHAQFLTAEDKVSETPDAFARRLAGVYGPDGDWARSKAVDYEQRVQAEF